MFSPDQPASFVSRRLCICAAFALGHALLGAGVPVRAQAAWPTKPIRLIVPYPPGGTSDAVSRLLAERLRAAFGQNVVVENRAGASGNTGIDAMAKAPADGYAIAFAAISPLTLNPHLMRVPYDPLQDIAPVASVMYSPVYLVATSAFPGKTFADVLAQAKARPGKVTVATSGIGSVGHLMLEQLDRKAGISLNHIPYKGGGQVVNDAAGAHFELFTTNPSPAVNGLIAEGKLRMLAIAAPQRLASSPDVPTFAELGFAEANLSSWFGVFAPARTPPEVIAKLHDEVNRVLGQKDVQDQLTGLFNVVSVASTEQFVALIKREYEANARVVKAAGIKAE